MHSSKRKYRVIDAFIFMNRHIKDLINRLQKILPKNISCLNLGYGNVPRRSAKKKNIYIYMRIYIYGKKKIVDYDGILTLIYLIQITANGTYYHFFFLMFRQSGHFLQIPVVALFEGSLDLRRRYSMTLLG